MQSPLGTTDTILAATDFSASGNLAVMRAALITQQSGKELHLLYVVHPLDLYPELMLSFDAEVKDYERLKHANGIEQLDELAANIRHDYGITVKTASRIGRPHVQIAEYAANQSADLIVTGFNGENKLLDVLMGSTAFRLLKASSCPVLIVRNKEVMPYKQVLSAVDLSLGSISTVALGCTVAPRVPIEMLHVYDLKNETMRRGVGTANEALEQYREEAYKHIDAEFDKMMKRLDNKHITPNIMNGYLPETICSRVEELNADLVVLGKRKKNSLQEFALGSVSKAVASTVSCDVLLN